MEPQGGAVAPEKRQLPLVVDLDGTLLKTDLLFEALFELLATAPLRALRTPLWLRGGKAGFKIRLADVAVLRLHEMPLNEAVLDLVRTAKAEGRPVYLASASDARYVRALADHLGLFDGVFATDAHTNLAGAAKERVLVEAFGAGGFDYVGNATVDLGVWRSARTAYVVDAAPGLIRAANRVCADVRILSPRARRVSDYLRALRMHQWLKNLLILVPGLAAHVLLDPAAILAALLAFLSFSLCASSVYLLNDLLDLGSDRAHATKRHRPFAAGTVPLVHGVLMFPVLLAAALLLAVAVSPGFLLVLVCYYALTLGYSLLIKRKLMVDVVVLACLYGMRVVAGAVALGLPLSKWLIAFSIFLFLSLALVKRAAELANRLKEGRPDPAGRAYRLQDLPVLEMLATASGFAAVLVMAFYVDSPEVLPLYRHPELLRLAGLVLICWIGRILILTHRGEMHEDPVVFAMTDRSSLAAGAALGAIVVAASL